MSDSTVPPADVSAEAQRCDASVPCCWPTLPVCVCGCVSVCLCVFKPLAQRTAFASWKYAHYFQFASKKDKNNIMVKCTLCGGDKLLSIAMWHIADCLSCYCYPAELIWLDDWRYSSLSRLLVHLNEAVRVSVKLQHVRGAANGF